MDRFIPSNLTKIIDNKNINAVVYINEKEFIAMGFSGKRRKHDFYHRFETKKSMENFINEYFEKLIFLKDSKEKNKKLKKEQNEKLFKDIKVGDIFECSWGYEQTNVDFVQLIDLRGKTGTFKPIGSETIEEISNMSDYRKPVKDNFIGKEFKKRIAGDGFNLSSFQHFKKINEKDKFYCSWYY